MPQQVRFLPIASTQFYKMAKKASEYIAENPYFILSKSWCPDCHYIINVLQANNVLSKFYILHLDKLADQKEALELEKQFTQIAGRKWVPFVWIKGEKFGTEADVRKLVSEDRFEDWLTTIGLK